jgi:signal peptidase I
MLQFAHLMSQFLLLVVPIQCFTTIPNGLSKSIYVYHQKPRALRSRPDDDAPFASENSKPSMFDGMLSIKQKFSQASAEGFGTKARNVAKTMSVGDVVVPICGDLALRQILANRGVYAGVEYKVFSLKIDSKKFNSMDDVPADMKEHVIAKIKPAYKLRDYLERSDWPVNVNPSQDVPLWLSKTTYEAGTILGTLGLSLTYLSMAAIVAFFVRFTYVPSPSMQPALNPGDVVLVTRTIWPLKPSIGDVILFDPPPELNEVVLNSVFAQENGAALPTKGQQFLKRAIAKEGEYVGVKNSEPYVDLTANTGDQPEGSPKKFRVDIVGPYSQPAAFSESSWNRSPEQLGKNQWFVAGDNGFRSVDSRVWGALDGKYILGSARWVLWPIQDFGPIKEGQIFNIEK